VLLVTFHDARVERLSGSMGLARLRLTLPDVGVRYTILIGSWTLNDSPEEWVPLAC
jgi:hypothetical protein